MLGNRQIFSQAKPNNNTSTPAPGKVPPPCSRGTGAATRCVSERWKISPPGHPFGYPSLHKNRRASDEHEIHSDLEQRKCKTEGKQVWEICWLAAARALLARRRRPGIAILRRALWLRTPARSRNPTRHPPLTRQAKRRHLLCGPLPEGKPPCYYGFPMVFPLKPPLTRGYHQRSIPPKKKTVQTPPGLQAATTRCSNGGIHFGTSAPCGANKNHTTWRAFLGSWHSKSCIFSFGGQES